MKIKDVIEINKRTHPLYLMVFLFGILSSIYLVIMYPTPTIFPFVNVTIAFSVLLYGNYRTIEQSNQKKKDELGETNGRKST